MKLRLVLHIKHNLYRILQIFKVTGIHKNRVSDQKSDQDESCLISGTQFSPLLKDR